MQQSRKPGSTTYFPDTGSMAVPLLALISHVLLFSLGQGAATLPTLTELLQPERARPLSLAVVSALGGLFAFANTKTFGQLQAALGDAATFAVYAAVNAVGAGVIRLAVPKQM